MVVTDIQIAAAKEQGYSDEDIQAAIAERSRPDEDKNTQALAAGYSQDEIDLAMRQKQIQGTDFSQAELATPEEEFARPPDVDALRGEYSRYPKYPLGKFDSPAGEEDFLGRPKPRELERKTIIDMANEIGVDPTTQEGINAIYNASNREYAKQFEYDTREEEVDAWYDEADERGLTGIEASDYVGRSMAKAEEERTSARQTQIANFAELVDVPRPYKWFKSNFGPAAKAEYAAFEANNIEFITKAGADRGVTLQYEEDGGWFYQDAKGKFVQATPGFLDTIGKSKYEVVGALGGAIAGAKFARTISDKLPGGKWAGRFISLGIINAAGALGAVAGDQIDYLQAAMSTQEAWSSQVAAEKAIGAAEIDIIFNVVGGTAFKAIGASWKYARQAYQLVKDGNTQGAYTAMKHALGDISDEEVEEIVTRWEALNQMSAPGKNIQEKGLAIAPATQAGGEAIIAATTARNPTASSAISNEINQRAQTLLKASREAKGVDAGKEILQGLDDYTGAIKSQYDLVNRNAETVVRPSYKFNLPRLGVKPLLEHQIANVGNPAKVEQLVRILSKVEDNTIGRSFPELLDLYRTVNDFKYNGTLKRHADKEAVQEALATIKAEIEKQTSGRTKKGKLWWDDWEQANKDYTKFKSLEKNVLYKKLTSPGMTEDDIAKVLVKRGHAIDDTYEEVIRALPPKQVKLVENSIVDKLVDKATRGLEGEFRVTDFVGLDRALKVYDLRTPEAQRLKTVVGKMAEVFRNDPKLAAAAGKIDLPGFQSYLTTNPVARMQYELASHVFNKAKSMAPGREADIIAMVNKTAKLLEEPLNARTTQQVINAVKDDQELVAAIKRFQQEVAKDVASGATQAGKPIYKDSKGRFYDTEARGRKTTETLSYSHRTINGNDLLEELDIKGPFVRKMLTDKVKRDLLDRGINMIKLPNGQIIKLDGVIK